MTSRLAQFTFVLSAALAGHAAKAVVIEVTYPEQDVVRAALSEIDAVDDRVYTIRFDEDGDARIVFGDGIRGARPPSGGSVVASYRFGTGIDGNIVNEYGLSRTELPFIPITDFLPTGSNELDASFVIVGVSSLIFEFSGEGLRVVDVEITAIPEPGTLALLGLGLLLIAARRGSRK